MRTQRRGSSGLHLLAALATVGLLLAAACGGSDSASSGDEGKPAGKDAGGFRRVTPAELDAMLKAGDAPLINVHIPYEGELDGTDAFIPFDHITEELDQLPADKSAKIVLYCRSGRMSTEAAQALVGLGYTNVWELGGGMIAWEQAGFTVLRKPRLPAVVASLGVTRAAGLGAKGGDGVGRDGAPEALVFQLADEGSRHWAGPSVPATATSTTEPPGANRRVAPGSAVSRQSSRAKHDFVGIP